MWPKSRDRSSPLNRGFVVWAHINGLNQGDELVVETVLSELRRRVPGARTMTVSMFPPGAEERHGVPSHNIGAQPVGAAEWSLLASLPRPLRSIGGKLQLAWHGLRDAISITRAMGQFDTLVIAGSGPLEDDPGCAFRLWKWVTAARLRGAKVAVLSVGAGPLNRPINRMLVRASLRLAALVSVRDLSSVEVLRRAGVGRNVPVRPDMGWAWPALPRDRRPAEARGRRVGLNVMSLNDPRYARGIDIGERDWERFDSYIAKLTRFVERTVNDGFSVALFSTENHHDVRASQEFHDVIVKRAECDFAKVTLECTRSSTARDVLRTLGECDYVVATRFHAAVLSLACGTPTIGLAYHPKTFDLFARLGLGAYVIDAETFTADELVRGFQRLLDAGVEERNEALAQIASMRRELADQFDAVVSL